MALRFHVRALSASALMLATVCGSGALAAPFHVTPLHKCNLSLPIETVVKRGVPYRVARKHALAAGFTIFNHKKDWDQYNDCRHGDGIEMCHRYPEVISCSVDGYCAMDFRDKTNAVLRLITRGIGDLDRDKIDGWNSRCILPNGKVED